MPSNHYRRDAAYQARAVVTLAGPLIANNLAIVGMSVADTIMAGRLGAVDLAAVAVGSSVWIVPFLFGLGVLMAMSPIAAHGFAQQRYAEVGGCTRQCLWLSQGLAVISFVLLRQAEPLLRFIGIDPGIIPLTAGYVDAISWGLPAMYAYLTLRFTSEGIGWTRPIMYMALFGFVLNIAGNYVLMYGKLGAPALGAVGCGWASAIVMWAMLLGMLWYVKKESHYRGLEIFRRFEWPRWPRQRELLALGLPIGGSVVSEVGLFSAVALLMGTLGTQIVAAHQIAINYTSMMFMIPLALHSALTVRVGHAVGAGRGAEARYIGFVGIGLCGLFMCFSALLSVLLRYPIAAVYTSDAAVQSIAAGLLLMAAIFQIPDGLQVGAAGAVRGFKDTKIPMLMNFCGYWLVGFPLAWYLGIHRALGPLYVWVGLIAGLVIVAILLNLRFLAIARDRKRIAEIRE